MLVVQLNPHIHRNHATPQQIIFSNIRLPVFLYTSDSQSVISTKKFSVLNSIIKVDITQMYIYIFIKKQSCKFRVILHWPIFSQSCREGCFPLVDVSPTHLNLHLVHEWVAVFNTTLSWNAVVAAWWKTDGWQWRFNGNKRIIKSSRWTQVTQMNITQLVIHTHWMEINWAFKCPKNGTVMTSDKMGCKKHTKAHEFMCWKMKKCCPDSVFIYFFPYLGYIYCDIDGPW